MSIKSEIRKTFGVPVIKDHLLEKQIIEEISSGGNYECDSPVCGHKWISKMVERKCPKCNSKLVSLRLKKKAKYEDVEISSLSAYSEDEI